MKISVKNIFQAPTFKKKNLFFLQFLLFVCCTVWRDHNFDRNRDLFPIINFLTLKPRLFSETSFSKSSKTETETLKIGKSFKTKKSHNQNVTLWSLKTHWMTKKLYITVEVERVNMLIKAIKTWIMLCSDDPTTKAGWDYCSVDHKTTHRGGGKWVLQAWQHLSFVKQDHLRMNDSTGSNSHRRFIDLFRSMII